MATVNRRRKINTIKPINDTTQHLLARNGPRPRWNVSGTLGTVILCLVSGWIGIHAARPFVTAAQSREDNDDLERRIQELHVQNQRDERQLQMLSTPKGIERAARQLDFVEPGEHLVIVPTAER